VVRHVRVCVVANCDVGCGVCSHGVYDFAISVYVVVGCVNGSGDIVVAVEVRCYDDGYGGYGVGCCVFVVGCVACVGVGDVAVVVYGNGVVVGGGVVVIDVGGVVVLVFGCCC